MPKQKQWSAGEEMTATKLNKTGNTNFWAHQQSTPNMTLYVEDGVVNISGTVVKYAGGNSPSFTAPTSNPRIDLLAIDNAGSLSIIQGTEAASPSAPTYPTNEFVICEIYLRVGTIALYNDDQGSNGYVYKDARPFLSKAYIAAASQIADGIINEAKFDTPKPPTGSILMWGTDTPPTNYLLCDGSAISRTTYAGLFAVIGTTYGSGNGSTTFNLPNMKGRVPVGKDASQTEFDALGETGGAKTHTLTTNEMPAHTHSLPNNASGSGGPCFTSTANMQFNVNSGSAGNGAAHNNLQPYIVLNFIIKA